MASRGPTGAGDRRLGRRASQGCWGVWLHPLPGTQPLSLGEIPLPSNSLAPMLPRPRKRLASLRRAALRAVTVLSPEVRLEPQPLVTPRLPPCDADC
jgi:hypothetical protein